MNCVCRCYPPPSVHFWSVKRHQLVQGYARTAPGSLTPSHVNQKNGVAQNRSGLPFRVVNNKNGKVWATLSYARVSPCCRYRVTRAGPLNYIIRMLYLFLFRFVVVGSVFFLVMFGRWFICSENARQTDRCNKINGLSHTMGD